MKGTLLVTGFEPFGPDDLNPSGEVAKLLHGTEIEGHPVIGAVLPVEWGTVYDRLGELMKEHEPIVVLSLGLAGGLGVIAAEKVAVNYTSTGKDNKGVTLEDRPIIPDGPDAYFATIPTEELVEALKASGIPARQSLSAGAYLCNYAFYSASHLARITGRNTKVGFFHLPATPEMVARRNAPNPSMDLPIIQKAVELALRFIVTPYQNVGSQEGFLGGATNRTDR